MINAATANNFQQYGMHVSLNSIYPSFSAQPTTVERTLNDEQEQSMVASTEQTDTEQVVRSSNTVPILAIIAVLIGLVLLSGVSN